MPRPRKQRKLPSALLQRHQATINAIRSVGEEIKVHESHLEYAISNIDSLVYELLRTKKNKEKRLRVGGESEDYIKRLMLADRKLQALREEILKTIAGSKAYEKGLEAQREKLVGLKKMLPKSLLKQLGFG